MTAAQELDRTLRPGERIGDRWIVRDALGSGGHATVYLAEHSELGHRAAIKVLHLERVGAALEEMLGRFRREARIGARVRHANVARVFDYGELEDGSPFFVMDAIRGEDLQQRIDRDGPLPIGAAIDAGLQVLAGLHALAEAGVVHRDVKPGNVMLEPSDRHGYLAKLVDLGIASVEDGAEPKMTIEGTVLGTPEYMSPEQIRGVDLDPRADVYSLGVVLYEALTAELPFAGKGPCATLAMALTQDPTPLRAKRPSVPIEIEAIVMRALQKKREDRWESALTMAVALADTARALGITVGPEAWLEADAVELGRIARKEPANDRPPSGPRAKRPAARARRSERELDDSSEIAIPELESQARSIAPALARVVIAIVGLGLATAMGIGLTEPERLAEIDRHDRGTVETILVPTAHPSRD